MDRFSPVGSEEILTTVEHLSELRARILGSVASLGVAFALCLWQNHLLLRLLNAPLPAGQEPITLGVTEPFMTTVTVAGYAALLLALPMILYQVYAFCLPALSSSQRRGVVPSLLLVPVLFVAGVVFGYLIVLPAAIKFLLHFNAAEFNIQIRAHDYYGFVSQTLVAMGLVFQVPVAILAATRLGVVTPQQLRGARRYAYVAIAAIAMILPGTDPVTMLVEMVPLVLLYEISIALAALLDRRGAVGPSADATGAAQ